VHGKEEGGQQVGREEKVLVLTAESDLWRKVCCNAKGEAGGGAGGGTEGGGLEMILVWLVDR
jgi:hypothetical protein